MSREASLWGEVLVRAILDAIWPNTVPGGNQAISGVSKLQQQEARAWFRRRDFATVCHLAGFDPEFILARVVPLFDASPEERMDFAIRVNGKFGLRRKQ